MMNDIDVKDEDFIDIKKEDIKTLDDLIHYNIDDGAVYCAKKMLQYPAGECPLEIRQYMLEYKNREMLAKIMKHLEVKSNIQTKPYEGIKIKEEDE